jgi:hypothetical protein
MGKKGTLQDCHLVGHPSVLGGAVMPEVLMGIDAHGLWNDEPLRPELARRLFG